MTSQPINPTLAPFGQFLGSLQQLESLLVPILIAAAVLTFFYGLITYLWNSRGDAEQHEKDRKIMVWGLVALFVMVSVWGIVQIVRQAFGLNGNEQVNAIVLPGTSSWTTN